MANPGKKKQAAKVSEKMKPLKFEMFLKENPQSMNGIRMEIPTDADKLIAQYQKAFKKQFGRHISKRNVIWKMIAMGSNELINEVKDFED